MAGAKDGVDANVASVLVDDEEFLASEEKPLVFGRAAMQGVVGLDAKDMGISSVAGSIAFAFGVWWVRNESTKRPLLVELPGLASRLEVAPGGRYALTAQRVSVLVVGAVFTHVLEVTLPDAYVAGLREMRADPTTGTLLGAEVTLSQRERDALIALCAGYLWPFPRRREHPMTYSEAAELLGSGWSADQVRKAVERVKTRFAERHQTYFSGPQANYDLAAHLVSTGVLGPSDLARLKDSSP